MSVEDLDDLSVIEELETYLHDDRFPATCKPDRLPSCPQNDVLDKFLMRTDMPQTPLPHSPDHYHTSPTPAERGFMGVEGYPHAPGSGGHPEPLTSHWENVSVRNVNFQELEEAAQDLMNADMQQGHYQPQQPRMCSMQGPDGGVMQSAQAHSYLTTVKQEPEAYDQNMYSPYMESSPSESGFANDQSAGADDGDRKERRREQNRRAARKCREKKKRHQDSMCRNYEVLRGENNKLREEVDRLTGSLAELADVLRSHESSCPFAHTLPKLPAIQSKFGAKRRQGAAE